MSVAQPIIADSIAQAFLAEFETQAPITRRFLERLPEDKLTWKPHEKSLTADNWPTTSLPSPAASSVSCRPVLLRRGPSTFTSPRAERKC